MTIETTGTVPEANQALKSTDTSSKANLVISKEPEKAPVEKKPEVEPAQPAVPVEGENTASAADPTSKPYRRDPRWVREKLERERLEVAARTREEVLREIQQNQPKQLPVVQEEPRIKTLEDFDFDQGKHVAYLVEQEIKKRDSELESRKAADLKAEADRRMLARIDAFEERVGGGAWQDIEESPIQRDSAYKPLVDLFLGDDHDLDIAHHLATNPSEAERILKLPPIQRLREIERLAKTFEGGSQPEAANAPAPAPAPLPKRTTSAPPPPKTVSGSGKPSVDIGDPNLSTAERISAWRKAGKR